MKAHVDGLEGWNKEKNQKRKNEWQDKHIGRYLLGIQEALNRTHWLNVRSLGFIRHNLTPYLIWFLKRKARLAGRPSIECL